jgi:serine/threonine protein kinase
MKFTFGPESRPLEGYTLKRAIARGGFGEVYYALTDSGKEVALKLLQENLEVELRGVTQCLNLKHPNLVTLFDIKQDRDGDHWIVMEYVGGKTLDRVIHEHPAGMPPEEVLEWLEGIAAGIRFLHDRGIVHRDLKPANIFRENGVVKVGDVGLSKFIAPSRRSAHTQSVGTVYYMAPEVAKGRYDRGVDVYSLAVILYEMCTGKVPFDGETTAEILMKHLTERPNLNSIPEKLRPVFERALEKDPALRTSDVAALAQEFRTLVVGLEAVTVPSPALEPSVQVTATGVTDPARPASIVTDTQPWYGTSPSRPSVFENPPVTKSWWQDFWRSTGRFLNSSWRSHPLLIVVTLAAIVLFVFPKLGVGSGGRFVTSLRYPWLIIVGVVAYQVFRVVSHSVDALLAPRGTASNRGNSAGNRLIPHDSALAGNSAVMRRSKFVLGGSNKGRRYYRATDPNTVRAVSWRRRMTELTGSWAVAALATAVISGVLWSLTQFFSATNLLGHFAAGTWFGACGLLLLGKLREGLPRERYVDRLLASAMGVVVGAAMFQLNDWLLVELPTDGWSQKQSLLAATSISLSHHGQAPSAESYIAFFATLFGLRRWWWHCDSYRPHRFRILSVCLTAFVGAIAARVWGFPVLWGTVWAASLSSVVQLAAVWTPPEERC